MPRIATGLVLAVSLLLLPGPSHAAEDQPAAQSAPHKQARKKPVPRWHGYGFLPGYRPPEVIERDRARAAWARGPRFYGPAWPGFYRGRWNGGGFGPCYTYTPIGYVWNCGR